MREHMKNLEDDEKTKIIKSVVKLILNSADMVNLESSMYSLVNDMVNLDHQLCLILESFV